MPRFRTAYPPEFRRQMVDLVRSGRTPEELAREFEPTAQSISTWVKQADRDAGKRIDGPTSAEREELARLRRESHRLRQERDILARRRPSSRGRARRARTGLPVHERAPGPVSHSHNGPRPEGFGLGLLRLAKPAGFGASDRRRRSDASYPHGPRRIAWNLWRAACPRRAEGQWPPVGRKRIARLMRAAGIAGVSRRRSTPITTRQATDHHPASDLVRRNFMAERPNALWVADLPTSAGFLYLAVVLDAWSRRIVGWAFSADLKTRVVLDALDMTLVARKPGNVVHHSDSQRITASFRTA
jgi:transposase-like protein